MKKHEKHLHHRATQHQKASNQLKNLVRRYNPVKERVGKLFLVTFVVVLLTLLIFRNWGTIVDLFTPEPKPPQQTVDTDGYKTGALSVYKIDDQEVENKRKLLTSIPTEGSTTGVEVSVAFGQERGLKPASLGESLRTSVWLTNYLSTGQHQTKLIQGKAQALAKSIISTYYLGEKTVDIDSTLQTDSKILSQIKNTLSVDLFQYLNQSVNRADTLDEYLNLLNVLLEKTDERINDLQYKIDFLAANFQSKEQEISLSEDTFFQNLQIFDAPNAEEELAKFVGLREVQAEIRAKLGAYNTLQDYYKFFKPRLENLIIAIKANRSALIAGVKVVEIQNMTLPLIIKPK
jgi:hypothetical protein